VKGHQVGDGDVDGGRGVMSSSPPPIDGVGDGLSPSKPGRSSQAVAMGQLSASQVSREQQNAKARTTNGMIGAAGGEEDDEGGMGGFDLARGFQPIGSFHSHSSQSHAHIGNNAGVNTNAARASS
jgi:forkhead protein FKH